MNWRGSSRFTTRSLLFVLIFEGLMHYRVSAKNTGGSIVGVIVESPEAALAKLAECLELGFSDVEVSDLNGKTIDIVTLAIVRPMPKAE
jgi:hypothetical protein